MVQFILRKRKRHVKVWLPHFSEWLISPWGEVYCFLSNTWSCSLTDETYSLGIFLKLFPHRMPTLFKGDDWGKEMHMYFHVWLCVVMLTRNIYPSFVLNQYGRYYSALRTTGECMPNETFIYWHQSTQYPIYIVKLVSGNVLTVLCYM